MFHALLSLFAASRRVALMPVMLAFCLAPLLLTGCGGSGASQFLAAAPAADPGGQARVSIIWPPSAPAGSALTAHAIPAASNSIRIALVDPFNPSGPINAQVLTRPAATATFTGLPVRALTVLVTAFASTDGSGLVLASASGTLNVVSGTTATLTISLGSVVDHLTTTYNAPDIMASDGGVTLGVAGYNLAGDLIPLTPGQLTWATSAASKVTVSAAGVIAQAGAGAATITVTDTESGKTLDIPVLGMTFTVVPASATMSVGDKQLITGTVTGPGDVGVQWSVAGSAGSGSIAPDGTYTAPAAAGAYTVTGISHFDPKRQLSATVTVQSGSGTVTVQ